VTRTTEIHCRCGQVRIEVEADPIISTECHCSSCRAAAARLTKLPAAPAYLEPNGGTRFVLYRKDRVVFAMGHEHLREFRLTPVSKTRRVIASCCNTPVLLEFPNGHWFSLYAHLWRQGALPRLQERTMTGDLADPSALSADVPNRRRQSMAFFWRLLRAWAAMGFRSPEFTVQGALHA
jgi:Family of unknown function (DUF6151)